MITKINILLVLFVCVSPRKQVRSRETMKERIQHAGSAVRLATMEMLNQSIGKNTVISPLSILGAMYMTAACTKPGSPSEREIIDTLWSTKGVTENDSANEPYATYAALQRYMSRDNPKFAGYTLSIANGIFYQKGHISEEATSNIKPLSYMLQTNSSTAQAHDFASQPEIAQLAINKWVSDSTRGKIPQIIEEPIDTDTLLILTSSLYFKSGWKYRFRQIASNHRSAICWRTSVQDLKSGYCAGNVKTMQLEHKLMGREIESNGVSMHVIEIPLLDKVIKVGEDKRVNRMEMQIWVPKDHFLTDPKDDEIIRKFITANYEHARKKLQQVGKKQIDLIMPAFSLHSDVDLKTVLQNMGIRSIFNFRHADFSPILAHEPAEISQVKHVVDLKVNHEGAEGAASTVSRVSSRTINRKEVVRVNKPFYFFISNRCFTRRKRVVPCAYENVPVFAGRVINPISDA